MAVWRNRSLQICRTEARYLVGIMTYGVVWDYVYELALPESRAFTAYTGDDKAIHRAACYPPNRIGHLYKCRPPSPSDIMQPGERRLHVPFVNRPFESEIHGMVNSTQFCCGLLVTWCYRVLLSCYLRPK